MSSVSIRIPPGSTGERGLIDPPHHRAPVDISAVISVGRVGEEAEDRARSRTSSRVDLLSYGLVNLVTGYEALDGIRLRAHIRCLYRDEHLHARTSGVDETRVHLDRLARSDRIGEVNVADGGRDAAGA